MSKSIYILLLLIGLVARTEETNVIANASASAAINENSFDQFKIIAQRNIFDPNRAAPGQRRRSEDKPKPIRIDYLNLLGAMSYEKGQFAFFDGTSSEYRKSVKAGDSIAGYKVAEVTQNRVTLTKDEKKVELPVGGQMKRQDEGEWQVNTTSESFNIVGSSSSSTSTSTNSTSKSDSDSAESDALKRLLERRKQEK